MKSQILLASTETTGSVQTREMVTGDRPTNVISPASMGLRLAESNSMLAAMQAQPVQAQTNGYCDHSRKCSHCGSRRAGVAHAPTRHPAAAKARMAHDPIELNRQGPDAGTQIVRRSSRHLLSRLELRKPTSPNSTIRMRSTPRSSP